MNIAFNGQFTSRRMTGQERFAYEILLEIDKLISVKHNAFLVVPTNAVNIPPLKNISIIKYGKAKGFVWEQTFFAYYVIKNNLIPVSFCTVFPILKPGYVCIHDIIYRVHKNLVNSSLYSILSRIWHLLLYAVAFKYAKIIFTVSKYSKNEIIEYYNISEKRICVIGNGWQHFNNVQADNSIFSEMLFLNQTPYFFSLGSVTPHKNVRWIIEIAKNHPQYNFVIGGNINKSLGDNFYNINELSNVYFLGFISNERVKSLMSNCVAFIFPSIVEGFGIPPMEAMSVETKIIISNIPCLKEIYGSSAYYIDPFDYNINLDHLMSRNVASAGKILNKYSYERFAEVLYQRILKNEGS